MSLASLAKLLAAVALLGVGCAHPGERAPAIPPAGVVFPLAPLAPPAASPVEPLVVFDQTSAFGRVLVRDEGRLRVMRFGTPPGSEQSEIVRDRPNAVPMEYARLVLLGLGHVPGARRVLMVGLGGGTITTLLHRARPDLIIDGIEIDPVVVAAARACFGLRDDDHYRVHVADAAAWLARDASTYDYVVLDAYAGEDVPAALASQAFFASVRAHLTADGVVALNIAEPEGQGAAVANTFASVLPPFEKRCTRSDGNIILFGASAARATDTTALLRFAAAWDARAATDFSMRALALSSPCAPQPSPGLEARPASH